jgi:hypothetical protein
MTRAALRAAKRCIKQRATLAPGKGVGFLGVNDRVLKFAIAFDASVHIAFDASVHRRISKSGLAF